MIYSSCRVSSLVLFAWLSTSSISYAQVANTLAVSSSLAIAGQRLGGRPPTDAVIAGDVTITAGSTKENGTVRIVTKGTTQTAETFNTPTNQLSSVFAGETIPERKSSAYKGHSFERMLSAQSALSPLTFLSAKLGDASVQTRTWES